MKSVATRAGRFFALLTEPSEASVDERAVPLPTLEELFRRHSGDVHRLIWRLLGPGASEADVEDLGQQVFVAVHRALPGFRREAKVSTWLYGIAARTVYRELRNRSRHRRMVSRLEATERLRSELAHQDREVERRAELAKIWRALLDISPKKRVVFVLHEIEGLSGREIAEHLSINESTVHTRLHHARRELQRALEATP